MNTQQKQVPTAGQVSVTPKKKKSIIKISLWAIVILALLRICLPLLHPGMIFVRKYLGLAIVTLLLLGLCGYIVYKAKNMTAKLIAIMVPIVIGVGLYFAWSQVTIFAKQMYYDNMNKSLKTVTLKQGVFPYVGSGRTQPLDNMLTKGYETVQQNLSVSIPHLMWDPVSKETSWNMGILPDTAATVQRYVDNVKAIYSIPSDKTKFAMKDYKIDANFSTTDNSHLWKGTTWNAILKSGFRAFYMEPGQVFYGLDDKGKPIQITTLIKWEGFLIPVPKFGGVIVEESRELSWKEKLTWIFAGLGRYYSPEDIQKTPFLKGQNLLDQYITHEWAESFAYKEGYIDAVITKINQIEIPSFPHETNKPPYVVEVDWEGTGMDAPDGLYHYMPLEAKGEAKTGLALSLLMPSDGTDRIYVYDHATYEDGVFGITAVPGKVRDQKSTEASLRDWSRSEVVEILPYVIDLPGKKFPDNFYWKSVVLTKRSGNTKQFDGSTEPLITLTNATNSQVIPVDANHPDGWKQTILNAISSQSNGRSGVATQKQVVIKQLPSPVVDTVYVDQNGNKVAPPTKIKQ